MIFVRMMCIGCYEINMVRGVFTWLSIHVVEGVQIIRYAYSEVVFTYLYLNILKGVFE